MKDSPMHKQRYKRASHVRFTGKEYAKVAQGALRGTPFGVVLAEVPPSGCATFESPVWQPQAQGHHEPGYYGDTAALRDDGYAVQSISNILATASSIFKEALVDDLITVNPCAGVKRLKKGQQPELEVWTLEERDRFLDLLYRENFPIFQLCAVALFTGLRQIWPTMGSMDAS